MRKNSILQKWLQPTIIFSIASAALVVDDVVGLRPLQTRKFGGRQHQQQQQKPFRTTATTFNMIVDPHDAVSSVANMVDPHHAPHESLQTLLSTLISTTVEKTGVAHGHSQSWFGPPDPYLSAGKSIHPDVKSMLDAGIVETTANNYIDPTEAAKAVGMPEATQKALERFGDTLPVMDGSKIQLGGLESKDNILPGFAKTGGILPEHRSAVPPEVKGSAAVAASLQWSNKFAGMVNKVPLVAFLYALFEFRVLRQGVDLYKEEIDDEENKTLLLSEALSVNAVRFTLFAILGLAITVAFG